MPKQLLLFFIFFTSLHGEFEHSVENSNFTISKKDYAYNYNRLRVRGDYADDNFFITLIGDGVNYFGQKYLSSTEFNYIKLINSDTPFKTQTQFHEYKNGLLYAKLYRLYGGYEDNNNRLIIGLQNISMGVGRIWTPTNLFNPKNIYALEPDETFGVMALLYTRQINDTSELVFISSQKEDGSFKYAGQYKAFLEISDVAIDVVSSDETTMLGLELEANLGDSGVEVRSEVAYIKNFKEFTQVVIGADYGFLNGVSVVVEGLYSSQTFTATEILLNYDSEIVPNLVYSRFYSALNLSYSFNIFLDTAFTYIESFNDKNSRFFSPTLAYTLNDFNSFVIGGVFYDADDGSEFAKMESSYYLHYSLSF